jgi:hypothetical protein
VGALVLVDLFLFIAAVILAGRAQGWFEGSVHVHAVFMDAEGRSSAEQGSFDLQEGDEVKIRSAKAGRVTSIEPLDDGGMRAVLEIKDRFHRYIRVDSVARVKRMFGLAGDTHVEISEGQQAQIQDGGSIPCYKDEEIMEIAKKALEKLEAAVVPMVQETSGVMSNANRIAVDLSTGDGLLGTMITDPEMTMDVREAIDHLNELLAVTSETVAETRRLIRGAQKHWLLRKYIPEEDAPEYISPLYGVYAKNDPALYRNCEVELDRARKSADAREISRTAYNMAICLYAQRQYADAELVLTEAELSGSRDSVAVAHHEALKALLHQRDKSAASTYASVGILDHPPRGMEFEEHSEFIATAYLLLVRAGHIEKAAEVEARYGKKIEKRGSAPARAAFYRGQARLLAKDPFAAATLCEREAVALSDASLIYGMAKALERGGAYSAHAEAYEVSALRYLAAAKSLHAQGFMSEGDTAFEKAVVSSQQLADQRLTSHIQAIQRLSKKE